MAHHRKPPPVVAPPAPAPTVTGRPFSSASPFNTPRPASTDWHDWPLMHGRHWWISTDSLKIHHAQPGDPTWTFKLPAYVQPSKNRNRPAKTRTGLAPANLTTGQDTDRILIVVQPDGEIIEVWNATINTTTRTVTSGNPANPNGTAVGWADGVNINTGWGCGTTSGANDGVTAANCSWIAGAITGHDIASPTIDHMLAIAMPYEMADHGTQTVRYRPPIATSWEPQGWLNTGGSMCGDIIGIPPGVTQPAGLSPLGAKVFRAFQTYGAFNRDCCGGHLPQLYIDQLTVTAAQVSPLYEFWAHGGTADMDRIAPLLKIDRTV